MKHVILSVATLLYCLNSMAQADSTNIQLAIVRWDAEEFLDVARGNYTAHNSYFVTYGNDSIQWVQDNGGYKTSFRVTGVEGNWNNILQPGSITYNTAIPGRTSGQVIVTRDGDWITIQLFFADFPSGPMNHVFTISTFQNQQYGF